MDNIVDSFSFLHGGGVMGALTRDFDWKKSLVGSPDRWPQSLRVMIHLVLNARHPMLVFWGKELIQFYNDAFGETLGPDRHPKALGAKGRECWEEIWPTVGPQIEHVMAGKGTVGGDERLIPITRNGRVENVWWTYTYNPIEHKGGVGGVLVICEDVTGQHMAKQALEDQATRLKDLFEQAPGFMAVLRGPNHVFEVTNKAYRNLVGDRNFIGKPVREAIPEAEGQGYFELLDKVYQTGKAEIGVRKPLDINVAEENLTKHTFLDFVYQPIMDANQIVTGIFVQGADVTDHVHGEAHLRLMNAELRHRVKNTLAMVTAIAGNSWQNPTLGNPLSVFQERLVVFAKAHDMLTKATWATAEVENVVRSTLDFHLNAVQRLSISGPPTIIGSKQALSLALAIHELATNAEKFGALSNTQGKILVTWGEELLDSIPTFHFIWQEINGPEVHPPAKSGFGTKLIQRVLSADFGGDVRLQFDPVGLSCHIITPMKNLASSKGQAFDN